MIGLKAFLHPRENFKRIRVAGKIIPTDLSLGPFSALHQAVNIPKRPACRALETNQYPEQFGDIFPATLWPSSHFISLYCGMNKTIFRNRWIALGLTSGMIPVVLLVCAILSGCRSGIGKADSSPPRTVYSRILLFPFQDMAAAHGIDQTVQGPLSGKVFVTGIVEPKAAGYISAETSRRLARHLDTGSVIIAREDIPVMGVLHQPQHLAKLLSLYQEAGRRQHADAVMVGYLYEFIERVGGNYGVEKPARISFELNLVSVASGRLVWQNRFIETQQALNENLFDLGKFIQRKGRWITAREMSAQAIEDMFTAADVF